METTQRVRRNPVRDAAPTVHPFPKEVPTRGLRNEIRAGDCTKGAEGSQERPPPRELGQSQGVKGVTCGAGGDVATAAHILITALR